MLLLLQRSLLAEIATVALICQFFTDDWRSHAAAPTEPTDSISPQLKQLLDFIRQGKTITPELADEFERYFNGNKSTTIQSSNTSFVLPGFNRTFVHSRPQFNWTTYWHTDRGSKPVYTPRPWVSARTRAPVPRTPTPISHTTVVSPTTTSETDPATNEQPRGPVCHLAEESRHQLRTLMDDGSFDYVKMRCTLTPDMPRLENVDGSNADSFVSCASGEACLVAEKRQELIQHLGGVGLVLATSKCTCRASANCSRRSLVHQFYPGTSLERRIDVGECDGTCSRTGMSCKPSGERTVNISTPQGSSCVKIIEECGCAGACFFKPHREVYKELKLDLRNYSTTVVDREIMTGTCEGTCPPRHRFTTKRGRCAPDFRTTREAAFVGGHGKLMQIPIVKSCKCH